MTETVRHTEPELRDLYQRYSGLVFSRCRMILKSEDDAWDATQEVFIRLHRSLGSIDKKESIYSWLLSTSTNYSISMLRRRRTESFDEEFHGAGVSAPQEKQTAVREIMRQILGPCDRKTREIVIYAYIYGYKQEEIARLTGMGESTIRKYLTKFKRNVAGTGLTLEGVLYG